MRRPGLEDDYANASGVPVDKQDTYAPDQHLHPENDPEHDGEIRYQRIPRENRANGPKRIWENCGLTYVKEKRKKNASKYQFIDDSRVIPYNPFLLLKYGCHINIEYVFGQKACKYIFKYLLKGIP